MKDIADSTVRQAIAAIDAGNIAQLAELIEHHPDLVTDRISNNTEGYFADPYLLWFVAGNPIRTGTLPTNILAITGLLIQTVKTKAPATWQQQIDYALTLVATGHVPKVCGVQIALIDLLIDAGASPNAAMAALTNGNMDAAQHLVNRGDELTLAIAVCLERATDIRHLAALATAAEKLTALAAAAFYGKAGMVKLLLALGADANGFPKAGSGFHSHATPLHQAVGSGSLAAVKLLVEAGASLDATDKVHNGTPLGWAAYLQTDEATGEPAKANLRLIEAFLRTPAGAS